MNNHALIVNILELLNGLPFKLIDGNNNNIILVTAEERLEIIMVGETTVRVTLPFSTNKAINIENLYRALLGLNINVDDLDLKSSVQQQLFRELKYYSIASTEPIKNMSLKYQVGYKRILDSLFTPQVA